MLQFEMSQEHYNTLVEELKTRKEVFRAEISDKVRTAKEHGDLKENAEYHGARDQQAANEARIDDIEKLIKNAIIINTSGGSRIVSYGSKVTIQKLSDKSEKIFNIVGQEEVDVSAGKISFSSPIGAGLKGRGVGERFTITTPAGDTLYEIIEIS